MQSSSRTRRRVVLVLALLVIAAGSGIGWWLWQRDSLPRPGSALYEEYADAFQFAVPALDIRDLAIVNSIAEPNLNKAVELIPAEPAGWANRGLLFMRKVQLELAEPDPAKEEKRRKATLGQGRAGPGQSYEARSREP